jgi:PTH2 family peptidyl-tRNA hydrolase
MNEKPTTAQSGDKIKQVIVIRKDLKMRRGKEIAQGSHASMRFLCERLRQKGSLVKKFLNFIKKEPLWSDAEWSWITGSFAKICLRVDSEQELLDLYHQALEAGLVASLVTDRGLTEFKGVPTNTAIAIGPDYASKIDVITSSLKLY